MKLEKKAVGLILLAAALWTAAAAQAFREWDGAWEAGRLTRLNRLTPTSSFVAHFVRYRDERSRKRLKEALTYYQTVRFYYPDMADAAGLEGFCYYHLGDLTTALAAFEEAARLNGNFFWWHYNRGLIYREMKDDASAVAALEAALNVRPADTLDDVLRSKIYRQVLFAVRGPEELMQNLKHGYDNAARILYRLKNPSVQFPQYDQPDSAHDLQARLF